MGAITVRQMSMIVATLGVLSFLFGIIAENKNPAGGTPIQGNYVVICKYPRDPSVALGYISFAFLIASTVAGYLSLFYPYKGKSIPHSAFFHTTSFLVFFDIALANWDFVLHCTFLSVFNILFTRFSKASAMRLLRG